MHAARLVASARLKRLLDVLKDGKEHTTMDLVTTAKVMAVSACVAELRANGAEITCEQRVEDGQRRWFYTMTRQPAPDAGPSEPPKAPGSASGGDHPHPFTE